MWKREQYVLPKTIGHDELFVRTKTEDSGILIGVWDLAGWSLGGVVMDLHGNIPIWVMITSHVLSGFYVFLFFLVMLEMLEMRGKIVFGMVGWGVGWGGNNDVWTNQYPYL